MTNSPENIHASAFAYKGAGCLLLGAPGSGKSAALAQAMVLGADFIADDMVELHVESTMLVGQAPVTLAGAMQLPGLGLIRLPQNYTKHVMHLAVELSGEGEADRLPHLATRPFCGIELPFFILPKAPHTPVASLLLYCQAMQENRILAEDWHPIKNN